MLHRKPCGALPRSSGELSSTLSTFDAVLMTEIFAHPPRLSASLSRRSSARQSRHFHLQSGRASVTARAAKRALDGIARVRRTLGLPVVIVAERIET